MTKSAEGKVLGDKVWRRQGLKERKSVEEANFDVY